MRELVQTLILAELGGLMLCELVQTLFPKYKLALYPDELKSTLCYARRVQRTDPLMEAEVESSVGPARPGFAIDHDMDGPVSLNVEIGRRRKKCG